MKVYISVDMEGISGIVHGDMMGPNEREFDRGRHLMTADANAAIEGLKSAGASYMLVNDSHATMRNLLVEDIHEAADLLSGSGDAKPHCQLEGADLHAYDAAVFVGYHAMAKTERAIHPHTIAGSAVSELRINDVPHGETGLNAAVLGSLGIPVILVTGDTTTAEEARTFLGEQVHTVSVKDARGRNAAVCQAPARARKDIMRVAKTALEDIGNASTYVPQGEFRLEVDFVTKPQCDRASLIEGIERLGPMTVSVGGSTPWEKYRSLWAGLRAALNEPAGMLA